MRLVEISARQFLRSAGRFAVVVGLPFALAACTLTPADGPLSKDVIEDSANNGKTIRTRTEQSPKYVYDVVDIDPDVAAIVSAYRGPSFSRTFGLGKGSVSPLIGVGDVMQITIFEAGQDGLFSTQDTKSTNVVVTVQPDGTAQVPYIGSVSFAGNTLDTVRASIVNSLKTRAVEPDVILTMTENASRTVSVNGAVGNASIVPLGLSGQRVTEVIARAGGPTQQPFDTFVSLTRNGKTHKALLQTLIEEPGENIFSRPGDQLYLTHDPQTFSILGSGGQSAKIPLGATTISVIEAIALAGGVKGEYANPMGFFVFRFEYEAVLKKVLGEQRFHELSARGIHPNGHGMYPIVYRLDMSTPEAMLTGQTFAIRNKDVVYLSRHPTVDIMRFLNLVATPAAIARAITSF